MDREVSDNIIYDILKIDDASLGMSIIKINMISISLEENNKFFSIITSIAGYIDNDAAALQLRFIQNVDGNVDIFLMLRIFKSVGIKFAIIDKTKIILEALRGQGIDAEIYTGIYPSSPWNKTSILYKEPCLENASIPMASFYYSVDETIGLDSLEFFKIIINSIRTSNKASIDISIMPAYLSYQHKDLINEIYAMLNQISQGIPDDFYGLLRDPAVDKHIVNYERFVTNNNFYDLCISITSSNSDDLERPLLSFLRLYNRWEYETFNLDQNLYKVNYPFIVYDEISNYLLKTPGLFWNREDAPLSLFGTQFLFTIEEVQQFFNIPCLPNDSIKGIRTKDDIIGSGYVKPKLFEIENIIFGKSDNEKIGISTLDLCKHIFVCGTPGSGKTVFLQNILYQVYEKNINFLVIEPAKKEYRALKQIIPSLEVFTPGNNNCVPFVLNPFIPPKGVMLQNYKSALIQSLEIALDMESTLKRLFREAINNCYLKNGWRETSTSDDSVVKFGLYEFLIEFKEIMKNNYDKEIKERILTAGLMRIKNMMATDPIMFDTVNAITIDELMSKPTVLELNGIEDNELKSMIMALILSSLFAYTKTIENEKYGQLNHFLLVEEAHVLLKPKNNGEQTLGQEFVSRILLEKRASGYAIGIADQSPENVSKEVTKQTGTKIVFNLNDRKDRELVGNSMAMDEKEIDSLLQLEPGQCYFYNGDTSRPIKIRTENFRYNMKMRDTISDNECKMQSTYWENNILKSFPYNECKEISTCKSGCIFSIRSEGNYLAERFYAVYFSNKKIDRDILLKLLSISQREFKSYLSKSISKELETVVINCAKCHLLRKIYLENNLGLDLKSRIGLMKNPTFIHNQ